MKTSVELQKRPFEKGDMVIGVNDSGNLCTGSVVSTNTNRGVLLSLNHALFHDSDCDIITIRAPRKGSKDARNIVAMLCKVWRGHLSDILDYHIQCNDSVFSRSLFWQRRKEKEFNSHSSFLHYEKAKSMLE